MTAGAERDARRRRLERWLRAGLVAVDGERLVRSLCRDLAGLPADRRGPEAVRLVAIGKAAPAMARGFLDAASVPVRAGLVITKDGHLPAHAEGLLPGLRLFESSHPVPDERGAHAAREALELAKACGPDEAFVVLISGGASALTTLPAPGLDLDDLARTHALLLEHAIPIDAVNVVRKHLSAFSGGRLALAARGAGSVVCWALSDVPGNRLDVIGSGPVIGDPSTFADALRVLGDAGLLDRVPARVVQHLERGRVDAALETPTPQDPALSRVEARVIGSQREALHAIRAAARAEGVHVELFEEALVGEAAAMGRRIASQVARLRPTGPHLLVYSGETIVEVRGPGLGGRNQEVALSLVAEWSREPKPRARVCALACGSDGGDGPTDVAGAFADAGVVEAARRLDLDPSAFLTANDSYRFFSTVGAHVRTGPTQTNVMDLMLVLVEPSDPPRD